MNWIPRKWQEWAALIAIVQFIVVVIALLYARRQQREVMRTRNLNATRQMLDEIGNPMLRKARADVLERLQIPGDLSSVGETDMDIIRSVAVAYDRVGYLIEQDLIPQKALFDFQRDEIEQLWRKIGPVVQRFRQDRERPNYCKRFEYLATEWLPEMKRKHG